jgi:hypothetical protein
MKKLRLSPVGMYQSRTYIRYYNINNWQLTVTAYGLDKIVGRRPTSRGVQQNVQHNEDTGYITCDLAWAEPYPRFILVSFITVPDFQMLFVHVLVRISEESGIASWLVSGLRVKLLVLRVQPTSASSKITYYSNVVLVRNEVGTIQYGLKGLKSQCQRVMVLVGAGECSYHTLMFRIRRYYL